jgi:5-methyltetrahydropteroyltriglutamate--homocysteine methyltransferase
MHRSDKRILTTHAGSLPRPKHLAAMFGKLARGEPVDRQELERAALDATRHVVRRQLECGIDIGNNGEQSRESFFTYVRHRMSGFGGAGERPRLADVARYPGFIELSRAYRDRILVDLLHAPKAIGEISYIDRAPLEKECGDFARVLSGEQATFTEPFMTAPSPGIIAAAMLNEHYASMTDYINALAEALRVEYETIASRGYVLQIDAPDLAMEHHVSFADRSLSDFLNFVDTVIAAINRALDNVVPPERVRLHVCWGNYEGPHNRDVALAEILPHLCSAHVGALMLSMANPRHEHEYRCFERYKIPSGMLLIVGAIDTTTNYVEHPEVVADRIERAATALGDPHCVLAGTDCGFETTTGLAPVDEELVWEKLRALREGADIATRRLLGA